MKKPTIKPRKAVSDMKAVLISIQPKWCELIASGKKTVEIRKTKPKLETPFKCYIYATKGEALWKIRKRPILIVPTYDNRQYVAENEYYSVDEVQGKVIGEFVCDYVIGILPVLGGVVSNGVDIKETCLTTEQTTQYLKAKRGYGWHISDLVIYDKPKELSEFFHYCGDNPECDGCEAHYFSNTECGKEDYCCSIIDGCKPITRPPQSWCYVEERSDR